MNEVGAGVRKITCQNCNKLLFESPSAVLVIRCPRCGEYWRIEITKDGEIHYKAMQGAAHLVDNGE